jgi:hypothetical protein
MNIKAKKKQEVNEWKSCLQNKLFIGLPAINSLSKAQKTVSKKQSEKEIIKLEINKKQEEETGDSYTSFSKHEKSRFSVKS